MNHLGADPDRVLMGSRQHRDGLTQLAVGWQPAVKVSVDALNIGQHARILDPATELSCRRGVHAVGVNDMAGPPAPPNSACTAILRPNKSLSRR
jgi:hypothetical protein